MLKSTIPLLHVSDSERAEDFYCRRLGFRRTFTYRIDHKKPDPSYIGLILDGVKLHVSSFSGDGRSGAVAAFLVEDVDALYTELVGRGAPISLEPTDQTWGNRELYVEDPDGNKIRFIQEG